MKISTLAQQLIDAFRRKDSEHCGRLLGIVIKSESEKRAVVDELLCIAREKDSETALQAVNAIRFLGFLKQPAVHGSLTNIAESRFPRAYLQDIAATELARRPAPKRNAAAEFRLLESLVRAVQRKGDERSQHFLASVGLFFVRNERGLQPRSTAQSSD